MLCWLVLLVGPVLAQQPPDEPTPTPVSVPQPTPETPRADVLIDGLRVLSVGPDGPQSAQERARAWQAQLQALADRSGEMPHEVRPVPAGLLVGGTVRLDIVESDLIVNECTRPELEQRWLSALAEAMRRAAVERAHDHVVFITRLLIALTVLFVFLDLLVTWAVRRFLRLPGWGSRVLLWATLLGIWLASYPNSRRVGLWLLHHLVLPVWWILLVVALGLVGLRLVRASITFYFRSLEQFNLGRPDLGPRWRQQMAMYEQVLRVAAGIVVGLAMFFLSFAPLNVDWWALVTGAGFVTAAIGLAAQDLLRDYVAGFNIVVEDQFGVGDVIRVAGAEGVVEAFTMRVTRVRDLEGSLITIPNSSLRMVTNLSNTWSQVDLKIAVGYQTDVRKALEVIEQEAIQLLADWPDKVAEPPVIMGLDQLGESSMVIRMTVRTFPLMQFPVRRELLLRVKERFDREGIEIPYPQRVVWLRQLGTGGEHVQEDSGDVRRRGEAGGGGQGP